MAVNLKLWFRLCHSCSIRGFSPFLSVKMGGAMGRNGRRKWYTGMDALKDEVDGCALWITSLMTGKNVAFCPR